MIRSHIISVLQANFVILKNLHSGTHDCVVPPLWDTQLCCTSTVGHTTVLYLHCGTYNCVIPPQWYTQLFCTSTVVHTTVLYLHSGTYNCVKTFKMGQTYSGSRLCVEKNMHLC
jgi:hypothetical protein